MPVFQGLDCQAARLPELVLVERSGVPPCRYCTHCTCTHTQQGTPSGCSCLSLALVIAATAPPMPLFCVEPPCRRSSRPQQDSSTAQGGSDQIRSDNATGDSEATVLVGHRGGGITSNAPVDQVHTVCTWPLTLSHLSPRPPLLTTPPSTTSTRPQIGEGRSGQAGEGQLHLCRVGDAHCPATTSHVSNALTSW